MLPSEVYHHSTIGEIFQERTLYWSGEKCGIIWAGSMISVIIYYIDFMVVAYTGTCSVLTIIINHVCFSFHAAISWIFFVSDVWCAVQWSQMDQYNITGYSSTLYIRIAIVFVFSPYIWKFICYFQFQVIVTYPTTHNCMPNISPILA